MVTLKEYEIYLKVKKYIKTEGCDEADLIPKLINGVAYIPLIIESEVWNQLNIIPYQLLLRAVAFLNKQSFMPIGIGKQE